MKLGSGFAPIPEMLRRGIPVCLGSDGMASNNNHNLFHDMYLQALIYKGATLDPTAVHAPAGAGGGDAHRRAVPGPRGLRHGGREVPVPTCACWISRAPPGAPRPTRCTTLVYAGDGADVVLTMCDGEVIYRAGEWPTIDVERAKAECVARTARIISEL